MNGGILTLEFSRLLTSVDSTNDRNIDPAGTTHFLWAAHDSQTPTDPDTFPKHTNRGPIDIILNQGSQCPGRADDITVIYSNNS